MKVKELIEELQKLDGENECVLFDDSYNNGKSFRFLSINTIEEIISNKDQTLVVIGYDFDLDVEESGEGEDLSHLN
jgi:hypothetical protein